MDRYTGKLETDVFGIVADDARLAHLHFDADMAAPADDDGIHAGIAGATSAQVVTADIANPPYPRNITVTPADTTDDVKAGTIVVHGTNIADEPISEDFAFAANATTAKTGVKAFKTVKSIDVPAQDGTGCTFKVGFGVKFGLPFLLDAVPPVLCWFNRLFESTMPTVTADADEIEKNVFSINGTLADNKMIDLYVLL